MNKVVADALSDKVPKKKQETARMVATRRRKSGEKSEEAKEKNGTNGTKNGKAPKGRSSGGLVATAAVARGKNGPAINKLIYSFHRWPHALSQHR